MKHWKNATAAMTSLLLGCGGINVGSSEEAKSDGDSESTEGSDATGSDGKVESTDASDGVAAGDSTDAADSNGEADATTAGDGPDSSDVPEGNDATTVADSSDSTDAPDGTDAATGSDSPDATDAIDGTDATTASESSDASDATDGSDGTSASDSSDASDAADGSDGTSATDASDASDAPDGSDGTSASDSSDATDATDGSDGSDGTDGTSASDSSDATDGSDGSDGTELPVTLGYAGSGPGSQVIDCAVEGLVVFESAVDGSSGGCRFRPSAGGCEVQVFWEETKVGPPEGDGPWASVSQVDISAPYLPTCWVPLTLSYSGSGPGEQVIDCGAADEVVFESAVDGSSGGCRFRPAAGGGCEVQVFWVETKVGPPEGEGPWGQSSEFDISAPYVPTCKLLD